jgi:hypothetical protein
MLSVKTASVCKNACARKQYVIKYIRLCPLVISRNNYRENSQTYTHTHTYAYTLTHTNAYTHACLLYAVAMVHVDVDVHHPLNIWLV